MLIAIGGFGGKLATPSFEFFGITSGFWAKNVRERHPAGLV